MKLGWLKWIRHGRRPTTDHESVLLTPGPGASFRDEQSPLFEVALDDCVGHLYYGFGLAGWSPFSSAVAEHIDRGGWERLAFWYDTFQPKTLSQAYFLRSRKPWASLDGFSPFQRLKPWRASVYTMAGKDGQGNQHFGPISATKFQAEVRRYERVLNSIGKNGYAPRRFKPIVGYFLIRCDGRAVFRITNGMHRAAVLDALGHARIEVGFDPQLPRYVHEATVDLWPHVRSGRFSPELALYVFRRHFWDRGNLKQRWIAKLS